MKKLMIILAAAGLLYGCCRIVISQDTAEKSQEITVSESGDWMLTDDYASRDSSFEDFLKQKDAYDTLKETYEMLNNAFGGDYYDVGR